MNFGNFLRNDVVPKEAIDNGDPRSQRAREQGAFHERPKPEKPKASGLLSKLINKRNSQ